MTSYLRHHYQHCPRRDSNLNIIALHASPALDTLCSYLASPRPHCQPIHSGLAVCCQQHCWVGVVSPSLLPHQHHPLYTLATSTHPSQLFAYHFHTKLNSSASTAFSNYQSISHAFNMTSTSAHVKNPSLSTESLPKKRGETRDVIGQLEYLSPMTDEWVCFHTLHGFEEQILTRCRNPLYVCMTFVDECFGEVIKDTVCTYTSTKSHRLTCIDIPKKHGNVLGQEPLNYTSFLARDQAYGPLRCNRNSILFQLKPTDFGVEPTDYVRDNGNIVLDAFDHGIRDFGDAMPLCLSTEVEGHDIETYKRRNMKIAMYDIIGRLALTPDRTSMLTNTLSSHAWRLLDRKAWPDLARQASTSRKCEHENHPISSSRWMPRMERKGRQRS